MLSRQSLKNLLQKPGYSRSEKMMLCLAVEPGEARAVKDVRGMAVDAGLRQAQKWNISRILAEAGSHAARTREGWELTDDGWSREGELAGTAMNRRATRVDAGL